jgi:hypothetical protein
MNHNQVTSALSVPSAPAILPAAQQALHELSLTTDALYREAIELRERLCGVLLPAAPSDAKASGGGLSAVATTSDVTMRVRQMDRMVTEAMGTLRDIANRLEV